MVSENNCMVFPSTLKKMNQTAVNLADMCVPFKNVLFCLALRIVSLEDTVCFVQVSC